jgi:hypothetical protein
MITEKRNKRSDTTRKKKLLNTWIGCQTSQAKSDEKRNQFEVEHRVGGG